LLFYENDNGYQELLFYENDNGYQVTIVYFVISAVYNQLIYKYNYHKGE